MQVVIEEMALKTEEQMLIDDMIDIYENKYKTYNDYVIAKRAINERAYVVSQDVFDYLKEKTQPCITV